MIICPVCKSENGHLSVVCLSCGSYIQTKIDTLDLFSTAWQLLEKPQKAFHSIAVARHKNFAVTIAAIAGVSYTFSFFWFMKAGDSADSLINFLISGFTVSPLAGLLTVLIVSIILKLTALIGKKVIRFRNAFAVVSYSQIPAVISGLLILPLEIMTFGVYFFGSNPSPYQLKPLPYVLLLGLDGLFGIWSFLLLWLGIKKLTDYGYWPSLLLFFTVLIIFTGIMTGLYLVLLPQIQ